MYIDVLYTYFVFKFGLSCLLTFLTYNTFSYLSIELHMSDRQLVCQSVIWRRYKRNTKGRLKIKKMHICFCQGDCIWQSEVMSKNGFSIGEALFKKHCCVFGVWPVSVWCPVKFSKIESLLVACRKIFLLNLHCPTKKASI